MFNLNAYLSNNAHSKHKLLKMVKVFHKLFLGLLLVLACSTYSHASAPAGYSEYYIPGDEGNMYLIFNTMWNSGLYTHAHYNHRNRMVGQHEGLL